MRRPFITITIPMVIGIVFFYYFKIHIHFLLILILASILLFLFSIIFGFFKREYLIFIFFIIGIFITYTRFESSVLIKFVDKNIELKGTIEEIIYNDEDMDKYIVNVEKIKNYKHGYFNNEKMILKVIGKKGFEIGDEVSVFGILKEPKKNTNPKLFNYKLYLQTKGIYTTMTVKEHEIEKSGEKVLPWHMKMKLNFRNNVELVCNTYLKKQNSSIMKAILLGDSSYLEERDYNKFRDLGLSHIMAVSGLHIGIISIFLITFISYIGIERRVNTVLTLIIIWIYGFLIGYPPSVLRALIMFTILFYSKIAFRRYDSLNTFLFTMFIVLVINPLWLFDIGFKLSFAATFFITSLTPIFRKKFYPYNGRVMTSLYAILSVQIGLAPILVYYFNSISIISILGNFILIPLLSKSVVLGFILLLFSYFNNGITLFIGKLLNILLNINHIISEGIYGLPLGKIRLLSPSMTGIISYYLIIFSMFKIIKLDKFNYYINKVIIAYLIFLMLFNSVLPLVNNQIYISFIDVGQGDCILIEDGNSHYLIDTGGNVFGNFDIGENILLPYLIKRGIFTLDGVFVTHFHDDHCKSLPTLMENINVKKVFIGHENKDNKLYNNILDVSKKESIPIYKLTKKDKIYINKNSCIEVLGPTEKFLKQNVGDENNISLVLMLKAYDREALFTGDIEEKGEMHLLENSQNKKEKIEFLKVPHHGSNTSSKEELINFFSPDYAFIQVGESNRFNHPSEEVLERYEKRNIKIFRTDESGLITLSISPKDFNISVYNKNKLSIEDVILEYGFEINYILIYLLLSYIIIKRNSYLFKELSIDEI